ncbi:hypothetical protein HYFRA_00002668, partial [Hymenoscyphus fraxineus]
MNDDDATSTTSSSRESSSPRLRGAMIGKRGDGSLDDGNGSVRGSGQGNGRAKGNADTFESTDSGIRTIKTIGILPDFKLRGKTDDLPQYIPLLFTNYENWWFASTTIPLLAATIGPLANVLSIAALVTKWRDSLPNNGVLPEGADTNGVGIPDPRWCIILNAFSLGFGFFGNFCLLLNFTKRVRYIVALPATIIAWYFATGILIGIIVGMNNYVPPIGPGETYSQGFYYAIIAAVLYMIGSMILMVNMLGYALGHYPQHFDLDDDQRTLILQTMMFFFWLAGGAAVFSKVCGFTYVDALYFCDVTVLTVGFGDFVGTNDAGRGIVFPYSVIGIIFLGLMINSIHKFAVGMSKDKVIRKHQLQQRERTYGRTVTSERELRDRLGLPPRRETRVGRRASATSAKISTAGSEKRHSLDQYGHIDIQGRTIKFKNTRLPAGDSEREGAKPERVSSFPRMSLSRDRKKHKHGKAAETRRALKKEKLILLKEEKDRFDTMREIQANTQKFERYWALSMSVIAFSLLWLIGALVFHHVEKRMQGLSYFQALYFCYVSLLTIGYGDFSPKSNAGKPFFVIWSLIAVPTMTILISDMGDTVISAINRGTFTLADWTVMPKEGVWHDFLEGHPRLKNYFERKTREREERRRIERGFEVQDPDLEGSASVTLDELVEEGGEPVRERSHHELARQLAVSIKRVAGDMRAERARKYSYEEWVEFTRLIRFSSLEEQDEVLDGEGELGLTEWDWIGEDSPMLAEEGESEWLLQRLCESLDRYTRIQARKAKLALAALEAHNHRTNHHHPTDLSSVHPLEREFGLENRSTHSVGDEHPHGHERYPAHPGKRAGVRHEHFGRRVSFEDGVGRG